MELSVTDQALTFAGAAALGIAAGLLYDLLGTVRRRAGGRVLGGVLDLLFWLLVTAVLFLYALEAGDGRLRLFMPAGAALGAGAYFLTVSPAVRRAGDRAADAAVSGYRLLIRGKKFFIRGCKKLFPFRPLWYTINRHNGTISRNDGEKEESDR